MKKMYNTPIAEDIKLTAATSQMTIVSKGDPAPGGAGGDAPERKKKVIGAL